MIRLDRFSNKIFIETKKLSIIEVVQSMYTISVIKTRKQNLKTDYCKRDEKISVVNSFLDVSHHRLAECEIFAGFQQKKKKQTLTFCKKVSATLSAFRKNSSFSSFSKSSKFAATAAIHIAVSALCNEQTLRSLMMMMTRKLR